MKGDFSRISFDPQKASGPVLLQQGRVLLDADFNAQGAFAAYALRQLTRDLLGPYAGPSNDLGFTLSETDQKLALSYGRYYVDGLAVSNPAPPPNANGVVPPLFYTEPSGEAYTPTVGDTLLFYLDVWERTVSWLEDGALREIALGGPDTALRSQVAWVVRRIPAPGTLSPATVEQWISQNLQRENRLPAMQAATDPRDDPDDTPCITDPLGGYRGLENQLYRVEIHAVANNVPSFKWSRDNGSVAAAWTGHEGNDLVVAGVHDAAHGFSAGQWVELTEATPRGDSAPGVLVRLVSVDRDRLTFDPASAGAVLPNRKNMTNPIIRRWDHRGAKDITLSGGAISLEPDKTYTLERGIKVRFRSQAGVQYRSGDYWLIPARTASADIEWPRTTKVVDGNDEIEWAFRPPEGVHHAYAPLALVTVKAGPSFDITLLQRKINQLWI